MRISDRINKFRLFIFMPILVLSFVGCAHSVHQAHVSDFEPYAPIESGEIVKGYAEQFVIFGFVGQTDYVNQAYANLMQACGDGRVTGITTQMSTSLGFFSWTNKALMQGLCISKQ